MGNQRPAVRLLHASDLHLGASSAEGCGAGVSCLCPLLAVEQAARAHDVDAILLAGDLFDHARLKADVVERAFDLLAAMPVPTVLLAGNHDVHDDTSLYLRHAEAFERSGVVFLDGETSLLDGKVRLWGRAMREHEPRFRPLANPPLPPADQHAWYVVMAHGHHMPEPEAAAGLRSSPITAGDIAATGSHYVALGHWHVTTDVSAGAVSAWYSGSPFGFLKPGNVLVVDLHPATGVNVAPVRVDPSSAVAACQLGQNRRHGHPAA